MACCKSQSGFLKKSSVFCCHLSLWARLLSCSTLFRQYWLPDTCRPPHHVRSRVGREVWTASWNRFRGQVLCKMWWFFFFTFSCQCWPCWGWGGLRPGTRRWRGAAARGWSPCTWAWARRQERPSYCEVFSAAVSRLKQKNQILDNCEFSVLLVKCAKDNW